MRQDNLRLQECSTKNWYFFKSVHETILLHDHRVRQHRGPVADVGAVEEHRARAHRTRQRHATRVAALVRTGPGGYAP